MVEGDGRTPEEQLRDYLLAAGQKAVRNESSRPSSSQVQKPGIYNPDGTPVIGARTEGEIYIAQFNSRAVPVIVRGGRLYPHTAFT